jgi:predicted nucleic acid-binding protein
VPITVLPELEWLLRSDFGFDKPAVLSAMFRLLGLFEVEFESEAAVEAALAQHERGAADFADGLHAALAVHVRKQPLWTFDKAAAGVHGAKLLPA